MPFAAKKPCATHGCSGLVASGSYCEACGGGRKKDRDRRTSTQRGYGARWQRASKAYLLAHPIAVDWFGEHDGRPQLAEVVDHRIPHRGDMVLFWDSDNWQGLTKADHDRKTAEEDGGFGRRCK
jgi:5-methylcytosine-specific restriction protein A